MRIATTTVRLNKNKLFLQIVGLNLLNTKEMVWRHEYNVSEACVCVHLCVKSAVLFTSRTILRLLFTTLFNYI